LEEVLPCGWRWSTCCRTGRAGSRAVAVTRSGKSSATVAPSATRRAKTSSESPTIDISLITTQRIIRNIYRYLRGTTRRRLRPGCRRTADRVASDPGPVHGDRARTFTDPFFSGHVDHLEHPQGYFSRLSVPEADEVWTPTLKGRREALYPWLCPGRGAGPLKAFQFADPRIKDPLFLFIVSISLTFAPYFLKPVYLLFSSCITQLRICSLPSLFLYARLPLHSLSAFCS